MLFTRITPLILISTVASLSGCSSPQKSVQRLDITDSHADSFYVQVNHKHAGGNTTQVELGQTEAQVDIRLSGATKATGEGEKRLRNVNQDDPDRNQIIGPATVNSQHTIQQLSVRSIFHVDDKGRFQFDVAPQLSLLHLDSSYRTPTQSLQTDFDKVGGGILLNMKVPLYKMFSFNLAGSWLFYSGDTDQTALLTYVRIQPNANFYIDLGAHHSYLDLGTDSGMSYEQKVKVGEFCAPNCAYGYDGTSNSDTEIATSGYRLGVGWNF